MSKLSINEVKLGMTVYNSSDAYIISKIHKDRNQVDVDVLSKNSEIKRMTVRTISNIDIDAFDREK